MLDKEEREFFEAQLAIVLAELPPLVKQLLVQIPLVVDDYPSPGLCRKLGLKHRGDLCGLYAGVSLDKKSIDHGGQLSDTVYLFRDGILNEAADDEGNVSADRLREEIRITILHEYGHHHGLDEDELRALGY
jgi:predicted Zn-dependent protease with MMP-like domain